VNPSCLFLALMLALAWTPSALAKKRSYQRFRVDWTVPGLISEQAVHLCDDTFYERLEVAVPGRPDVDFLLESNCSYSVRPVRDRSGYIYSFDAMRASEGFCKVWISTQRPDRLAEFLFQDAC
jgi:hypothetical protein